MAREHIAETIERLEQIIEPIVDREGFELVDVVYKPAGKRSRLQVMIDRQGRTTYRPPDQAPPDEPGGVGIGDCVRVSKALSHVLDVEDVIPSAYHLEVTSPGIDRPLKRPEHFDRARGMKVRVKTRIPVEGASFFVAPLVDADADRIALDVRGERVEIPYRLIANANLEVEL
ncbi:MAG: ribosome maturation factor RimP [Myxococcota bacterium]